jgi:RHS repeat-associated protein
MRTYTGNAGLHATTSKKRYGYFCIRIFACLLPILCCMLQAFAGTNTDGGIKDAKRSIVFTGTADVTTGDHPSKAIVGGTGGSENFLPGTALTSLGETNRKVATVVSFSVKEETLKLIPTDFTATIVFDLTYGPSASASSNVTVSKTLTVDYKKDAGTKYNPRAYFTVPDAEYVKIKITSSSGIPSITSGSNTLDTREIVILKAEMEVTRYFELSSSISMTNFSVTTKASDLGTTPLGVEADYALAKWAYPDNKGINMIQLEWAWIEDETADNYKDGSGDISYALVFGKGATRVDLPPSLTGSYKIPFLYNGSGMLYVRIRPCNIKASGNRSDGDWSYTFPQHPTTHAPIASSGHEPDLNWQVTTSFAEEGKSKTVIGYFDGSLRSRQTVTKDNVLGTVLASETFYDYQGRPAVQILPTPTMANVIKYQTDLNLFNGQASNAQDPAAFFDLEPTAFTSYATDYLKMSKGSAKYYSTQNAASADLNENRFIPNANGYPFTVTRYTPDATGRVLAQSGVGQAHAMGNGHVTKYFYGSAAQVELDALFGVEAGDFSHYSKNMIKDANGQMSVSYVDMHGRTVATALAGEAPGSPNPTLEPLKTDVYRSPAFSNQVNRNLLADNTNRVKNNNTIESINSLLVAVPNTQYHFTYELNTETLKREFLNCSNATICNDCMYDLEITITNEAGEQSFPHEDPSNSSSPASDKVRFKYSNVNLSADQLCSTAVAGFTGFTSNKIEFTVTPSEAGSYSIRKTLTISEASLNRYKELFKKNQDEVCFDNFYNTIKTAVLAASNCATPTLLACQDCTDNLGTAISFRDKYLVSLGYSSPITETVLGTVPASVLASITAQYNTALARCSKLCEETPASPTSNTVVSIRQMMLADMKPFEGQYARGRNWTGNHASGSSTNYDMHHKYDIFSDFVSNALYPHYKFPVSPTLTGNPIAGTTAKDYYYTPTKEKDLTINSTGNWSKLNEKDENGFNAVFKNSWASSLLPYHPEYNKLLLVESAGMTPTYTWLTGLNNQYTWPTSGDFGNVPGPKASTTVDPSDAVNAVDPFYIYVNLNPTTASATNDYYSAMYNKVNVDGYLVTGSYSLSMWQVAYGDLYCKMLGTQSARDLCYSNTPKNPAQASSKAYPFTASGFSTYADIDQPRKDQVWNVFKALYLADRQRQLNEYINDKAPYAVAGEGDQLIDHGYYLHFPANDQQIMQQGDGSGNNGSSWWPTTPGDGPTGIDLNPTTSPLTNNNYQSKCESYVPMWRAQLLQCPALAITGSFTSVMQEQVLSEIINGYTPSGSSTHRFGMIEVCVKGSDASNPNGASNMDPAISGQPASFEEVINDVYTAHSIAKSNRCNPYMIEWPKKRGQGPVISQTYTSVSDPCIRERFAVVVEEATAAEVNADEYDSFNVFMQERYHENITEGLYLHLKNFTTGSSEVLSNPEPMPLSIMCGYVPTTCINCDQLRTLVNNFKSTTEFGSLGSPYNTAPNLSATSQLSNDEIDRNELLAKYINYQTGLQFSWMEYFKKAQAADCPLTGYSGTATQNVICGSSTYLNNPADFLPDPCQSTINMAYAIAQNLYQWQMTSRMEEWEKAYRAKCLTAQALEKFTVSYENKEYHYTLYYYDQAGNLVKTVPPAGVKPEFGSSSFLNKVKANRDNYMQGTADYTDVDIALGSGTTLLPDHNLFTQYRYSSLNQVVEQKSPDGGLSRFWYDRLGRLVLSQNQKQAAGNLYSYTVYDPLGRITEVGELPHGTYSVDALKTICLDDDLLVAWRKRISPYGYTTGYPHQVTVTQYDISYINGGNDLAPLLNQQHLRNRVSYTALYHQTTQVGAALASDFNAASFYTYDIHGNVDELVQDYGNGGSSVVGTPMNSVERYKKMAYEYDLISGKVNKVSYQPGKRDQFHHRYEYDAENRLTNVETSLDDIYWECDARYQYYKHGPLARTVLGKQQVQGLDYAYTIQGWLKGVNSTAISSTNSDACLDGSGKTNLLVNTRADYSQPITYTATNEIVFNPGFASVDNDNFTAEINNTLVNCEPAGGAYYNGDMSADGAPNSVVARDAFGFGLNYFRGDYTPINTHSTTINPFAPLPTSSRPGNALAPVPTDNVMTGGDLFNGNIGSMLVNVPKLGEAKLYGYRYDQLNRIVAMNSYTGFNLTSNNPGLQPSQEYKERISYDPNGNIMTYLRNGNDARLTMDKLSYTYTAGTNQLDRVEEDPSATDAASSEYDKYRDIKQGQTTGNYQYDAIGNLIADASEHITNIEWTAYGKIAKVTKVEGSVTTEISYTYDATGNRISKTVGQSDLSSPSYTWYVRDASGNVMAVYGAVGRGHLIQTEAHLYGSSRLGIMNLHRDMQALPDFPVLGEEGAPTPPTASTMFERGNKFFELSNHLGNVLATVTDRKIQIAATLTSTEVSYFLPDVTSANDYYPFGMAMPGRRFNNDNYRYGFNGKENDKDVSEGVQDYGDRIYNGRIGRWLSIDPMQQEYASISPYVFAINSPIAFNDPNGKWVVYVVTNSAGQRELTFVAEANDNLSTLSLQLGLSEEALKKSMPELGTLTYTTGLDLKLNTLQVVQRINKALNSIEDSKDNCANVAAVCAGFLLLQQYIKEDDPDNVPTINARIKKNFTSVEEENAKIGDIITYKYTEAGAKQAEEKAVKEFDKAFKEKNPMLTESQHAAEMKKMADPKVLASLSKEEIDKQTKEGYTKYKENYKAQYKAQLEKVKKHARTAETHFAVVIYKSKDGKKVLGVLQKFGPATFERQVTQELPGNTGASYKRQPSAGGKSAIYTKKEKS